jgi:TAG lipase/steryl ester hydrolase/phospholipase A2/LPA acyltransferase
VAHRPVSYFQQLLYKATIYEQWEAAGQEIDAATGKNKWKDTDSSLFYDSLLLKDRLGLLQKARESEDLETMVFLLRTSLSRNIGDIGNLKVLIRLTR